MKIAYLASKYPAVSHTFIKREILELEALGVSIERFSVRRAGREEMLDDGSAREAGRTQVLLTFAPVEISAALGWTLLTRPRRALRMLQEVLSYPGKPGQRLKWLAYYMEASLLAWKIKRSGARHLHCHFGNAGSNVAWLAARLGDVPYSITFHGIDLDEPELFHHREKIRDAAFVVSISDVGRDILLRNATELEAGKVHVVRCGYDVPERSEIAPYPRRNRILCVARLSPEKGHEILIEALAILKRRGIAFHCTLVGDGPLERQIRSQIKRLGLTGDVTMTGALPPSDVYAQIGRSDLFALASFGEGIPIALMEALAQMRPVVATAVGGVPELVRDGIEGRLVAPGDPDAFADAIAAMLADPEASARMGEAGRRAVAGRHDPKESARQMRDLFVSSMAEPKLAERDQWIPVEP